MNKITWHFKNFRVASEVNGLKDVVQSFEWTCTAEEHDQISPEQESNHYVCSAYGVVYLEAAQKDNFIPIQNLTQDVARNWVVDVFGSEKISKIEADLQEQIQQQKNQSIKNVLIDL